MRANVEKKAIITIDVKKRVLVVEVSSNKMGTAKIRTASNNLGLEGQSSWAKEDTSVAKATLTAVVVNRLVGPKSTKEDTNAEKKTHTVAVGSNMEAASKADSIKDLVEAKKDNTSTMNGGRNPAMEVNLVGTQVNKAAISSRIKTLEVTAVIATDNLLDIRAAPKGMEMTASQAEVAEWEVNQTRTAAAARKASRNNADQALVVSVEASIPTRLHPLQASIMVGGHRKATCSHLPCQC